MISSMIRFRAYRHRLGLGALTLIGVMLGFAGPVSAADDDLLREALRDVASHDQRGWAYTQELRIDAEGEKVRIIETYDPSLPPGERRKIVEITEDDDGHIHMDEDSDNDADIDLPIYADLEDLVAGGVELVSEDNETAVYRLLDIDNDDLDFGDFDFDIGDGDDRADVDGFVTVAKSGAGAPYVSQVEFKNREELGNFLARVNDIHVLYSFAPNASGETYLLQDFRLHIDLEILIFIDIDIEVESKISDYKYVGVYGKDTTGGN